MKIRSVRERLLASTIIVGAATLALASAGQAAAQQASPPTSTARSQPGDTGAPVGGNPGGAVTIGTPAATGVTASASGQSANAVTEVVVTGSRIPQPNLTSNSPLTAVSQQEFKLEGTTSVETLLNNLPQFTPAQNQGEVNGSNGTSQANLRNLGPTRTLVLVNGRRLMPGDPGDPVPDLNVIPAAMVDRVDVVTGGASAVYGSDAVAGVVNFIMKQNFQGIQLDVQGGFDNHSQHNSLMDAALSRGIANDGIAIPKPGDVTADGEQWEASMIVGANSPDQKGNVTAYATFHNQQPVLQGTRDWSTCGTGTDFATTFNCSGSSNSAFGRFDKKPTSGSNTFGPTVTYADNPNGANSFVPYSSAYAYNFNPLNFLQRDDTRYSAGYFAHYQINPAAEVYSEFMFMDDDTNAQVAPSGLFRNSGPNLSDGYTINCNNPFLSAQQSAALCPGVAVTPGAAGGAVDNLQSIGYRFAAVPRNTEFRHDEYKLDFGIRGDISDAWHYDAYYQFGESILQNLTTGYASEQKVANALNVIDVGGVPTCVVGGSCVPLNIFTANSSSISQAAYNYVLTPGLTTGEAQENVINANLSGDLGKYGIKSPFADSGVGVNVGTEYRREQLKENFDQEQISGDLSGAGGASPPAVGSFDVYEIYTEVRLPFVTNMPFVKELSADAGYRFSDYSTAGTTNTFKIEGDYAPFDDVRFRASYNRATRAPNAVELFTPTVAGLGSYSDPCASDSGAPSLSQAKCALTGVTAAEYGNIQQCASGQCAIQTGGNTALKPEVALTYSAGVVFTPRFLHNFSASLDYFHVKVNKVISAGVASPNTILTECTDGNNAYCGLIHRDPTNGSLNSSTGYVLQGETNAGYLLTDGIDVSANYRIRLSDVPYVGDSIGAFGSLAFNLVGTWTRELTIEPFPGLGTEQCAGLFGPECGNPQPHWKSELRTTWITPWNLTLSLNYRYIGSSTLDLLSPNPLLNGLTTDAYPDKKIERYNYLDFAFTYKLRDMWTLRGGINNLFDRDPPIVDSNNIPVSGPTNFGNGNTFPGVYDTLGRSIFLGLTANF